MHTVRALLCFVCCWYISHREFKITSQAQSNTMTVPMAANYLWIFFFRKQCAPIYYGHREMYDAKYIYAVIDTAWMDSTFNNRVLKNYLGCLLVNALCTYFQRCLVTGKINQNKLTWAINSWPRQFTHNFMIIINPYMAIRKTIVTHWVRVSLTLYSYWWCRHNRLRDKLLDYY